jgi:hypothetical protein
MTRKGTCRPYGEGVVKMANKELQYVDVKQGNDMKQDDLGKAFDRVVSHFN